MNTQKTSPNKWVTLLIVGLIFFSPGLLQGCDSFGIQDEAPESLQSDKTKIQDSKLRFTDLLDQAKSKKTVTIPGKKKGDEVEETETTVHLVVGLTEYAGYDVTRRILSKYDVTRRILNKYGDDVLIKAELEDAISAITVEVNEAILDSLFADFQNDPEVAWVEPDIMLSNPNHQGKNKQKNNQVVPWGVAEVGALFSPFTQSRVQVFILDSGVTYTEELNVASSIDLTGNYNARSAGYKAFEDVPNGNRIKDKLGHGIAIAGTIGGKHNDQGVVGVAPGASLHSVRVLGKDGGTDITTLLQAIDYVLAKKAEMPNYPFVVNMSLGGDIGTTTYNAVDEAVFNAIEAGIVFVIAAGNDGINAETVSPAHVTEAITVGSYDRSREYSEFSNFGPTVDLLAPGEDIVSLARTYPANGRLQTAAGTSHATPHVTGAVVRYLTLNPHASPSDVEKALKSSAVANIEEAPENTTNLSVKITAN